MNKLYKDTQGNIYAVSPIQTPKKEWVALTKKEAEAHLNPVPTVFERIAEAQAPFIEEQALAKKEYQTADIEGDEEWKAEAQAEYQASIDAMKQATSEVTGG